MSLVPDYSGSSESSNESSDVEESKTSVKFEVLIHSQPKLPPPDFDVKNQSGLQTNSVFKNPFLEAENEKDIILQKHVKMVDLNNTVIINGKKICWNYRKGRCRFGHKCKFAHDSDIEKTNQMKNEVIMNDNEGSVIRKDQNLSMNNTNNVKVTRKRPGLTQQLIPGKKVMKNYNKWRKLDM